MFNFSLIPDEYKECDDTMDCLRAHEEEHIRHMRATNPELCVRTLSQVLHLQAPQQMRASNKRVNGGWSEQQYSEYQAYYEEQQCILKKLAHCPHCKAALEDLLNDVEQNSWINAAQRIVSDIAIRIQALAVGWITDERIK